MRSGGTSFAPCDGLDLSCGPGWPAPRPQDPGEGRARGLAGSACRGRVSKGREEDMPLVSGRGIAFR